MELFEQYWPVITGAITIPAIVYLKKLWTDDVPFVWAIVSILLNAGLAYGANALFGLGMDSAALAPYIMGGVVTSTVGHSLVKTRDKLTLN